MLLFQTILHIFAHQFILQIKHTNNYMRYLTFYGALLLLLLGCKAEPTIVEGDDIVAFSTRNHTFGILDSEEWFEIPIEATQAANYNRNVGVEVIAAESSAIEGRHFELESHTVTIKEGKKSAAVRIKGIPSTIAPNTSLTLKLKLILNNDEKAQRGTEAVVTLQRCCDFDINNFAGYAVVTSQWSMEYMNRDSHLVHTHVDKKEENVIVIEDFFYEGCDIRVKLNSEDRLNPTAELYGAQVIGSTGEAFGTIYGNGKLMCDNVEGYLSYYSTCENFLVIYTLMYVEEVGMVGAYVNILEWVSDDEAERIMREGI